VGRLAACPPRRRHVAQARRPRLDAEAPRAPARAATLASRNHSFDLSTPSGAGHDTGGASPPPRDGLRSISDLYDLFDFERG
jgi:hypothetical protein